MRRPGATTSPRSCLPPRSRSAGWSAARWGRLGPPPRGSVKVCETRGLHRRPARYPPTTQPRSRPSNRFPIERLPGSARAGHPSCRASGAQSGLGRQQHFRRSSGWRGLSKKPRRSHGTPVGREGSSHALDARRRPALSPVALDAAQTLETGQNQCGCQGNQRDADEFEAEYAEFGHARPVLIHISAVFSKISRRTVEFFLIDTN